MKNVLFRGKNISDNRWLYGSLISNHTEQQLFIDEHHQSTPVTPETVNQWIGLNEISTEETGIFEGDFLIFERKLINENDGFWNSNAGQIMNEHNIDEVIIRIFVSDFMEVKYEGYLKRNNQFLTECEYYKVDEEDKTIYSFRDNGLQFLKYLIKKGARVIGNVYDNPELLPVQQ